MNLREFTEAVDKLAEEMTQEELRVFLHSFARKVSEQQRREFVEILEMVKAYQNSEKEEGSFVSKTEKQDKAEIEKEYTRLKELFEEIEEGELYIDAEGYEDYSSGYWDMNMKIRRELGKFLRMPQTCCCKALMINAMRLQWIFLPFCQKQRCLWWTRGTTLH